jgi:hypothetical protein
MSLELGRTSEFDAPPLFVLPVDDIDLNPLGCVPLLELLRAVHSRHLFLIVMADRELVRTILELRYRGQLRDLAHGEIGPVEHVVVRDLAADALLKHFPVAQQVALTLQEPARALAFTPERGLLPLKERLGLVELASDTLSMDMETVTTAACIVNLVNMTDPDRYSWAELLRLPMRHIVDLYLDLAAADGGLADLARARLEEIGESALVNSSYPVTPGAAPTLTWERAYTDTYHEVWSASIHSWRISLKQGPLSSLPSAAYAGALDVLGDEVREEMRVPPFVVSLRQTRFPRRPLPAVDWPMPAHTTFWGYERLARWLEAADSVWRDQPDGIFGSWVAVNSALLAEAVGQSPPSLELGTRVSKDWPSLIDVLNGQHGPVWDHWLFRVHLLCTPEMGMSQGTNLGIRVPDALAEELEAELISQRGRFNSGRTVA